MNACTYTLRIVILVNKVQLLLDTNTIALVQLNVTKNCEATFNIESHSLLVQESRAAARKPRDAASVLFG